MKNHFTIIITLLIICFTMPIQAQSESQDLLGRINNLRAELGLSPYTLNTALTAAALEHAQWMAATSQVTHVQDNGSSPQSRAQANGYNSQWVSENIYMGGLASVDTAWTFWINSSIHYAGLTSPNFQNIGIATAQGEGGQAYVLVFGVPSGASRASNSSASTGGDSQAAAPPLAIVGYDEVGNIQYELQAGDTLGQVLLLFGYTWDDLNTILELNGFTDDDIRALSVGQVVLVPPPQGTYTPTPLVEESTQELIPDSDTIEVTEEITVVATNNSQPSGIIPTPLPTNEITVIPTAAATLTEAPIEALGQPVTFVAVTSSPTITVSPTVTTTPSPIPTLAVNQPVSTAIAQEAAVVSEDIVSENSPTPSSRPPMWLIVAIVIQVAVLGFASFEFFRRSRQ